ncbi:hypothetical protein [Xanthocytophaga flava]|nr:hypothetical protein [Xanthocytophaga flavus]
MSSTMDKIVTCSIMLLIVGGIVFAAYNSMDTSFKGKPVQTITLISKRVPLATGFGGVFTYDSCSTILTLSGTDIVGDRYYAEYDSEDCENLNVFYNRPVFLEDEKTHKTAGVLLSVMSVFGSVKFEYTVDGKDYERIQYIGSDSLKNYPNLREGQPLEVTYWVENPARSIVYLDK